MRLSAHRIKKPGSKPLSPAPREGSLARRVYDALIDHPGHIIHREKFPFMAGYNFNYLLDQYGLDVRYLGKGRYLLAGRFDGAKYEDYMIEAPDAEA